MEAMTALCDSFLPSIHLSKDDDADDDDSVIQFFQHSASMAGTPQNVSFPSHTHSCNATKTTLSSFLSKKCNLGLYSLSQLALLIGEKLQHPKIYLWKIALWMLSTRLGTFILCGRRSLSPQFPYLQRFSLIPSQERQEILLSWSRSYHFLLRLFFTAAKIFTLLLFFSQVKLKCPFLRKLESLCFFSSL